MTRVGSQRHSKKKKKNIGVTTSIIIAFSAKVERTRHEAQLVCTSNMSEKDIPNTRDNRVPCQLWIRALN